MEIKLIKRNRQYYPHGFCKDVGVTVSPKDKIIRLSFRNNCEKKIAKGDYAVVGYADSKRFFKGSVIWQEIQLLKKDSSTKVIRV